MLADSTAHPTKGKQVLFDVLSNKLAEDYWQHLHKTGKKETN